MAEREESLDPSDKRSAEDADAVSMQDLEMIFAPGKQPPPSLPRGSAGLSQASDAKPASPVKEIPKPPRPPRKAAAPPDIGAGDLAAFAALGGSIPPPPAEDEAAHAPHAEEPIAAAQLVSSDSAKASTETSTDKKDASSPETPASDAAADATPPPESKRLKARVLPRLRKPLPLPFPETRQSEEWNTPPTSALQNFEKLTSSNPPRRKNAESVDFDALLGMKSSGLSGSLSAPIVPPDLAALMSEPAPEPTTDVKAVSSPPRPKKKTNSDAIASAVTGHPSEPARRKKKGPPSTRAPRSSSAPPSQSQSQSQSTRPAKKETPSRAPQVTKEEKPSSRTPLYVLLAAAIFGGAYLLFRGSTPSEAPKAENPVATTTPTADSRPAEATPVPAETAAPVATNEPTAVATAAPTTTAPLFGAIPHPTAAPTGTGATTVTTTPTAAPTAAATAKPAVAGTGDFDRGAASAALGGVVGQAAGCKQSGDPSGTAHVQVTFAPSGHVTVANISGPPFAGTATGGCIARSFKTASIPPFSGDPVTVSKTVSIP